MKREHGLSNPQNQESPKQLSSLSVKAHAQTLLHRILTSIEEARNLKKCYPHLKGNLQYHKDIYNLIQCANGVMEVIESETHY